jgi:ribosomal protein S18 acetylase RimI-like enzyme
MPSNDLTFTQATAADEPRVSALVVDRARWIASTGSTQWSVFLGADGPAFVRKLIATGQTYLVTRDGKDVGTLRLQWEDRPFWSDAGEDGTAGYVHTLAIHRDHAGQRLVGPFFQWACEQIAARGRPLLRIDCAAHNQKLVDYYTSFGFEKRAIIEPAAHTGYLAQQLERSVSTPFR